MTLRGLKQYIFRCERSGCAKVFHQSDLPKGWCQTGDSSFKDAPHNIAAWCEAHWPKLKKKLPLKYRKANQ